MIAPWGSVVKVWKKYQMVTEGNLCLRMDLIVVLLWIFLCFSHRNKKSTKVHWFQFNSRFKMFIKLRSTPWWIIQEDVKECSCKLDSINLTYTVNCIVTTDLSPPINNILFTFHVISYWKIPALWMKAERSADENNQTSLSFPEFPDKCVTFHLNWTTYPLILGKLYLTHV